MFNNKIIFLLLISFSISPNNIFADMDEYAMKAILMSKISNYVDWPENSSVNDKKKPFVIGILGDNPFGKILENLYNDKDKKIKNKEVRIEYLKKINEIDGLSILFISKSKNNELEKILKFAKHEKILTISDTETFGEKGVLINFFFQGNKIKFELNESASLNEGFSIDYRLRKIAKLIATKKGGK